MKNIEKYTNTKDALEAYKKLDFKKVPFDVWLELEYEEPLGQTLLEAAEAVIDEWYYTQDNITLNDLGEKIVDLKNAIAREKAKPVRNCDKYKTAEEVYLAFRNMCDTRSCGKCPFREGVGCLIAWLYAEAEKEEAEAEKEESDE